MGYFDGMTSALIRQGHDGHRYYAPFGKFGRIYEVPDDQTSALVQARWRAFYMVLFGSMLGLVLYIGGNWRLILAAPLAGLLAIPFGIWAARGLTVAPITARDLKPVTRREAITAYSVATGRTTLGWILAGSVLMTGVGVFAAVVSKQASTSTSPVA